MYSRFSIVGGLLLISLRVRRVELLVLEIA